MACEISESVDEVSIIELDHVSMAVPNLIQALDLYRKNFGCTVSDPIEVPEQGVRLAYVYLKNTKLELMEPLGHSSPIVNFLNKHPAGGLHHICFTSKDANGAVKAAMDSGMGVLGGDSLKVGHHGRKLFFINPKDTFGSLIEIEESGPKNN